MQELAPLVYDLAIMLGLASIVVLLFQRIRQPVVLGYLVAGMIVGPYTPPYELVKDVANIQILSELGVIFLMFSLGLEFSFQKLTRVGFSATVTGWIEVILMILIGSSTGLLFGWSRIDSLFLGAALAISSTTIIIKAIDELGLKTQRFAELIFGVLIVEDLIAILLLVALSTVVVTKNIFSVDMLSASFKLMLVVCSWFLTGYFLVPPLFRKIAGYISQETLTIVSVALCLSLVCLAANFHYSNALGAFIMGSILAETVLVQRIEELIRPIRDIFAAVFFISVGMLIDPVIIIQNWPMVLILSLITIFGKIISTSIAALLSGQTLNTSLRVGFSMAQIGEFSFIIAALGLTLKVTNDKLFPLIVAVSGVTTFTTPYLIRLSGGLSQFLEKNLPKNIKHSLKNYSDRVAHAKIPDNKSSIKNIIIMRLLLNGMMIALIFILLHYSIFTYFELFDEESFTANILFLLLTSFISLPFIWGMLFAYTKISKPLHAKKLSKPKILMIWMLTIGEVAVLNIIYFHTLALLGVGIAMAVIIVVISLKQLGRSYQWFEKRLLANIKRDKEGE